MASRPSKRPKLDADAQDSSSLPSIEQTDTASPRGPDPASIRSRRAAFLNSISRPISPPPVSRTGTSTPLADKRKTAPRNEDNATKAQRPSPAATSARSTTSQTKASTAFKLLPSPFKLTSIRDLPASQNADTISLHDILGNPLIKEAWIFNFCFDVDWLMEYFDPDVRAQVKVKIVHGSWRAEDGNRLGIEDACRRWPNVEAMTAYLPDPFGTHHSKMFILFTHDDLAQVVIHTANMLHKDWTNMTQAVWQSPMLPKSLNSGKLNPNTTITTTAPSPIGRIGTGSRFKHDLMAYLLAYGSKLKSLRDQLVEYDFTSIRGALIASVPSRMKNISSSAANTNTTGEEKLWGYPSLFRALDSISSRNNLHSSSHIDNKSSSQQSNNNPPNAQPHVVCQVSSIATLPIPWLNQFFAPLCRQNTTPPPQPQPQPQPQAQKQRQKQTQVDVQPWTDSISIIYPTPGNVAQSLDGYASGGSIHTKAQSAAHLKQIATLRNSLCQWTRGPKAETQAGRDQAAPHVKTYVRFAGKPTDLNPTPDIEWALMTSANLSTQAWGTVREIKDKDKDKNKSKKTTTSTSTTEKEKEVVVQSFEIGVLVWPELFSDSFGFDGEDEPELEMLDKYQSVDTETADYEVVGDWRGGIRTRKRGSQQEQQQQRPGEGVPISGENGNGNGNGITNTNTNTTTTVRRRNIVRMVPVFGRDMPPPPTPTPTPHTSTVMHTTSATTSATSSDTTASSVPNRSDNTTTTLVGLRLPYDLPLTPYTGNDMPWSPQGTYEVPDRHGRRWPRDFY